MGTPRRSGRRRRLVYRRRLRSARRSGVEGRLPSAAADGRALRGRRAGDGVEIVGAVDRDDVGLVVAAGSNVTSAPEMLTAVHCEVEGHATAYR